jgi:hypothetical protein
MDQRSICLFLDRQGFSASDIHGQFVSVFGSDAIAYSTVTKYLRWMRCIADKEVTWKLESPNVVDQTIPAALDEHTFSSVRDLTKRTCILPTTVWRWLTNSIGSVVKHLRSVSHKLNDAQLAARVQMSNELSRILRSPEHQNWQYFITPWWVVVLFINILRNYLVAGWWIAIERERDMLQTKKKRSQSHGILIGFALPRSFQNEKHSMQRTISNIFWNKFLFCAQNLSGVISSFI